MGSFNTLTTKTKCPVCNESVFFDIQFKYGDVWQHTYEIGQKLKWGGNDIGLPERKEVKVEGIGGPCPNCGTDFIQFDITVKSDSIDEVKGIGTEREIDFPEGYLISKD